jgi:hypothetical protein
VDLELRLLPLAPGTFSSELLLRWTFWLSLAVLEVLVPLELWAAAVVLVAIGLAQALPAVVLVLKARLLWLLALITP